MHTHHEKKIHSCVVFFFCFYIFIVFAYYPGTCELIQGLSMMVTYVKPKKNNLTRKMCPKKYFFSFSRKIILRCFQLAGKKESEGGHMECLHFYHFPLAIVARCSTSLFCVCVQKNASQRELLSFVHNGKGENEALKKTSSTKKRASQKFIYMCTHKQSTHKIVKQVAHTHTQKKIENWVETRERSFFFLPLLSSITSKLGSSEI